MRSGSASQGLFGRSAEMAAVDRALASAAEGVGAILLIEGEPGIGKSRLLAAATDRAVERGMQVAAGCGEELQRRRAFGLFARAFADALTPGDRRLIAQDDSAAYVAHEAAIDIVEELALARPLLLAFDDVQWADPPSVATLAALCRQVTDLPLALVCAYRPAPYTADPLVDACQAIGAPCIRLGPLDAHAIDALVEQFTAEPAGDTLKRHVEGGGGNPFFVIELLRCLRDEHLITDVDGRAEVELASLPPTLRQSILRRVRSLSPEALDLLRGAAVLGGSFGLDDLAALLDRSAVSLHDAAFGAIATGLIEEDGARLRIRHDLIREAVYDDIPEAIRASLHRHAARVHSNDHDAAVTVASHLARAGRIDADPATVAAFRRAASDVSRRDPNGAAAILDRALALDALDVTTRVTLIAEQVPLLVAGGQLQTAAERARTALAAELEPAVDARLRISLAEALLLAGDAPTATAELETVVGSGVLDDHERVNLLADIAWARFVNYDVEAAAHDARAAGELAERLGDHGALATVRAVESRLAAFDADFERAIRHGEEAVRLAGDQPAAVRRAPRFYLGLALLNADRPDDAARVLAEGRRRAEAAGVPWAIAHYYSALIMLGYHAGRWDDASAEAEAARGLHVDAGTRAGYIQMESMLGLIWFHRGEHDAARDALARAHDDFATPGHDAGGIIWMLWLEAAFAETEGDVDDAARKLRIAFDLAVQLRVHSVKLWYGPDVVRLLVATGDEPAAADAAAEVAAAATRAQTPAANGAALLCDGLVRRDPATLLDAVGAYRASSRPLDLALACEAAGRELARRGRRDDACAALDEGLTVCDELSASHDARRIAAALRELGVRKGSRGPRNRPTMGIESLTPTERTVLQLLGEGRRNAEIAERLFVSRRTVETHVGRLYTKLGARGRVALAQFAASLPVDEPR